MELKVGDLVEYKYRSDYEPGTLPPYLQRPPLGLIVGFEARPLLGLKARVLWSDYPSPMLVDVILLNRFDPQRTKEYNAN